MNLSFEDSRTKKFATNVGLVTSNGPHGHNIMACEWTHHVSYSPSLISVCVNPKHATHENILESKEFGVSLCSDNQNILSSLAGGSSGRSINKIEGLKELGYVFESAKKIGTMMPAGACMSAECTLFKTIALGDHTMFVGEVVEIQSNDNLPLLYFNGGYWKIGETVHKPSQEERDRMKTVMQKHAKH